MKTIEVVVKKRVPENLAECDLLCGDEPGDDEYINYLGCVGCYYEDGSHLCKHRPILEKLEENKSKLNDMISIKV